jgi:glycosyltransferase involved in cell wall biosynthesis
MKPPLISIIMATYNDEKYISQTIDSILNQSFENFEFIIINDCSKDNTTEILSKYNDSRIKIFNNDKNMGLYKSLNIGFNNSSGGFIARIDADDIAVHNRLQIQYDYLRNNPSIAMVGCNYYEINSNGDIISDIIKFNAEPIIIKWRMCFENPVPSPVLFTREIYLKVGGFDERSKVGMDYDFFSKVSKIEKISNIQEPIMYWRVHKSSISSSQGEFQLENAKDVSRNYVNDFLNEEYTENDINQLWDRDWEKYNIIRIAILFKVYKKILNEKQWSSSEKKTLKTYITNKFIYHFMLHINNPKIIILFFKAFFLSPDIYLSIFKRRFFKFFNWK